MTKTKSRIECSECQKWYWQYRRAESDNLERLINIERAKQEVRREKLTKPIKKLIEKIMKIVEGEGSVVIVSEK
jgi:transcriptional regulator NrdR family protein